MTLILNREFAPCPADRSRDRHRDDTVRILGYLRVTNEDAPTVSHGLESLAIASNLADACVVRGGHDATARDRHAQPAVHR